MELHLVERDRGTIEVEEPVLSKVDYGPIFEKAGTKAHHRMLGEIRHEGKTIRITTRHVFIMEGEGDDMEITHVYENRNIARFIYVDHTWVYALKNGAVAYDNVLERQGGAAMAPGLYVYDFSRLLEGAVEVHNLGRALVGANDFIDFDFGMQTISFIKSYSTIRIMPLPHRNTIKFFGMGNKSDYLVWRQQDGAFAALDKRSLHVTMWSTVTGKIIKTEAIEQSTKDGEPEEGQLSEPQKHPIDHVLRTEMETRLR